MCLISYQKILKQFKLKKKIKREFFDSLLGFRQRMYNVKGPKLSEGGLYKFDISILTVDDYSKKLDKPLIYNAGISIAQTSNHEINDPNFGTQNIQTSLHIMMK